MIYITDYINWQDEKTSTIFKQFINNTVFEIIEHISDISSSINAGNPSMLNRNSYISSKAIIGNNVYIGNNCQIHDFACVRDNSILMDNVIVGHCSEIARSIIFSNSCITHKVTLSDSIIGRGCNLGACVSLASPSIFNDDFQRLTKTIIIKLINGKTYNTNLVKFGSLIGDSSKVGMNSSFAPGVILGKNVIIYPNVFLKGGQYEHNTIVKLRQNLEIMHLSEKNIHDDNT